MEETSSSDKKIARGFSGIANLKTNNDEGIRENTSTMMVAPHLDDATQANDFRGKEQHTNTVGKRAIQDIQPHSASPFSFWIIGVMILVGFGIVSNIGGNTPYSQLPTNTPAYNPKDLGANYQPSSKIQSPYNAQKEQTPAAGKSRPKEEMPPVGNAILFNAAQIRYCLAADIRMDGAKAVMDHYSQYDVERFNSLVSDYNNRCSHFQYRKGALEAARREVEEFRNEIKEEGRSSFNNNSKLP